MLFPDSAQAVTIRKVEWGFAGKVHPSHFNLVSVLVDNPTDGIVDVTLRLERNDQVSTGGMPLVESISLGPFQTRWVQFYPYVQRTWERYRVVWKDPDGVVHRRNLDEGSVNMPLGPRARVRLIPPSSLNSRRATWKAFSDERFPASVTGTSTLEAMLIDYAPRWDAARRQALRDWVYAGGQLFLAPDDTGKFPEFTGELVLLNNEVDDQTVGRGRVRRVTREQAESDNLDSLLPKPQDSTEKEWQFAESHELLSRLRRLTAVKHDWTLIHLLAIAYLGLVFPGWYLLARQRVGYGTTLLAFVGVVGLFSLVFNIVGRRGYGESTQVHTLAWARPLESGNYLITQWSHIFVTSGDFYPIRVDGTGNQYRLLGNEPVRGEIDNGAEGRIVVDIPLFSSRTILHRHRVQGPEISVAFRDAGSELDANQLPMLTISGLDSTSDLAGGALAGTKWYKLQPKDDGTAILAYDGTASQWLQPNDGRFPYYRRNEALTPERAREKLKEMYPIAVREALNVRSSTDLAELELDETKARVFLVAEAPSSWNIEDARFPQQTQFAVYEFTLDLPKHVAAESLKQETESAAEIDTVPSL